tara:strand:- start:349 stop:657 length:309 start_codon:yes stop_codon:yes gene_type:complete
MKVNLIYGTEKFTEDFLEKLSNKNISLEGLMEEDENSIVDSFIDIAISMNYVLGEDYYQNIGNLALYISKNYSEFYPKLKKNLKKLDEEVFPSKALLMLYGM